MATGAVSVKRVKRKLKTSQNPLFEKWLKEWKDEASSKGSEMQYCFSKALKSLQKFPIRLYSGKECMMLENFGVKLCQRLDDKLEAYKASHPEDLSLYPPNEKEHFSTISSIIEVTNCTKKRKSDNVSPAKKRIDTEVDSNEENNTKRSNYVPAYRSGGYAILIAMFEKLQKDNFKGFLTRAEIENDAQDLCDSSFKKPLPGSYYTAWTSMAVLIRKKLVNKQGKPVRYVNPLPYHLVQQNPCLRGWEYIEVCQRNPLTFGKLFQSFKEIEKDFDINCARVQQKLNNSVNMNGWPLERGFCQLSQPGENLFSLTEEGINMAIKLKQINEKFAKTEGNLHSPQKFIHLHPVEQSTSSPQKKSDSRICKKTQKTVLNMEKEPESVSEADETVFMLPGTFEIILLVDTQERDEKFQQAEGMTMRQLKSRNVNFEIRHLKVGDFIWIARDLHNGFELVLPYIVERKRFDDLASSIKDGRFHEQKFRLKQSGIENLIYLVEKYGNENQRLGLPLPSLMQAVSNTQVLDGFTVRITNSHDHSMRYLDCMTTQLSNLFKSKTLMSCKKLNLSPANLSDDLISLMTFKDFNKGSEKNKKPTVRNMLVKHLLQLNGVSLEKAQAIVQLYPTPKALMEGLKLTSGEKSIADVTYGNFNRSIGPVTAKQIRMLYTSLDLS